MAERRRRQVVEVYRDADISGAKGRDQRTGLDAMLKDAGRRKFDIVMACAIDRLGRSLIDLLRTIQGLEAAGVDSSGTIMSVSPRPEWLYLLAAQVSE
jgi:DNA invertase Pin-like site-specific DNA recombinase